MNGASVVLIWACVAIAYAAMSAWWCVMLSFWLSFAYSSWHCFLCESATPRNWFIVEICERIYALGTFSLSFTLNNELVDVQIWFVLIINHIELNKMRDCHANKVRRKNHQIERMKWLKSQKSTFQYLCGLGTHIMVVSAAKHECKYINKETYKLIFQIALRTITDIAKCLFNLVKYELRMSVAQYLSDVMSVKINRVNSDCHRFQN